METYNGWTNRDTWLVTLWLNNHEENYNKMISNLKCKGITPQKCLTELSDFDLLYTLKNSYYFGDKVNWNEVNIEEVRDMLKETKEDLI